MGTLALLIPATLGLILSIAYTVHQTRYKARLKRQQQLADAATPSALDQSLLEPASPPTPGAGLEGIQRQQSNALARVLSTDTHGRGIHPPIASAAQAEQMAEQLEESAAAAATAIHGRRVQSSANLVGGASTRSLTIRAPPAMQSWHGLQHQASMSPDDRAELLQDEYMGVMGSPLNREASVAQRGEERAEGGTGVQTLGVKRAEGRAVDGLESAGDGAESCNSSLDEVASGSGYSWAAPPTSGSDQGLSTASHSAGVSPVRVSPRRSPDPLRRAAADRHARDLDWGTVEKRRGGEHPRRRHRRRRSCPAVLDIDPAPRTARHPVAEQRYDGQECTHSAVFQLADVSSPTMLEAMLGRYVPLSPNAESPGGENRDVVAQRPAEEGLRLDDRHKAGGGPVGGRANRRRSRAGTQSRTLGRRRRFSSLAESTRSGYPRTAGGSSSADGAGASVGAIDNSSISTAGAEVQVAPPTPLVEGQEAIPGGDGGWSMFPHKERWRKLTAPAIPPERSHSGVLVMNAATNVLDTDSDSDSDVAPTTATTPLAGPAGRIGAASQAMAEHDRSARAYLHADGFVRASRLAALDMRHGDAQKGKTVEGVGDRSESSDVPAGGSAAHWLGPPASSVSHAAGGIGTVGGDRRQKLVWYPDEMHVFQQSQAAQEAWHQPIAAMQADSASTGGPGRGTSHGAASPALGGERRLTAGEQGVIWSAVGDSTPRQWEQAMRRSSNPMAADPAIWPVAPGAAPASPAVWPMHSPVASDSTSLSELSVNRTLGANRGWQRRAVLAPTSRQRLRLRRSHSEPPAAYSRRPKAPKSLDSSTDHAWMHTVSALSYYLARPAVVELIPALRLRGASADVAKLVRSLYAGVAGVSVSAPWPLLSGTPFDGKVAGGGGPPVTLAPSTPHAVVVSELSAAGIMHHDVRAQYPRDLHNMSAAAALHDRLPSSAGAGTGNVQRGAAITGGVPMDEGLLRRHVPVLAHHHHLRRFGMVYSEDFGPSVRNTTTLSTAGPQDAASGLRLAEHTHADGSGDSPPRITVPSTPGSTRQLHTLLHALAENKPSGDSNMFLGAQADILADTAGTGLGLVHPPSPSQRQHRRTRKPRRWERGHHSAGGSLIVLHSDSSDSGLRASGPSSDSGASLTGGATQPAARSSRGAGMEWSDGGSLTRPPSLTYAEGGIVHPWMDASSALSEHVLVQIGQDDASAVSPSGGGNVEAGTAADTWRAMHRRLAAADVASSTGSFVHSADMPRRPVRGGGTVDKGVDAGPGLVFPGPEQSWLWGSEADTFRDRATRSRAWGLLGPLRTFEWETGCADLAGVDFCDERKV